MSCALNLRREIQNADSGIRLAQVGRGRLESLFRTSIRTRSGVGVFDDGVGREVKISRTVRADAVEVAEELNGLQLAAEFQFEGVAEKELISRRKRQRLQRGVVQVGIRRSKTTCGHANHGRGSVGEVTRIGGAHDGGGNGLAVSNISAKCQMAIG